MMPRSARSLLVFVFMMPACGDTTGGSDTLSMSTGTDTTAGGTSMSSADSSSGNSMVTTGPGLGCGPDVPFTFTESAELGPLSVDAIRRNFEQNGVPLAPLYLVQVHGEGTNRLDIAFGGVPEVGLVYQATDEFQADPPVVGLYPTPEGGQDLLAGTARYSAVGVSEGELLGVEMDLEFARGSVKGCILVPIVVEFSAPP